MKKSTVSFYALCAFVVLFASMRAAATTFWWYGSQHDNDWTNGSNWEGDKQEGETYPKTTSDDAHFSYNDMQSRGSAEFNLPAEGLTNGTVRIAGGSCAVTINSGYLEANYLYVGANEWWGRYTGTLILNGGTLTIYDTGDWQSARIGCGTNGTMVVDGGTFKSAREILIADNAGIEGAITIKSGSIIGAKQLSVGGRGSAILTMDGGTMECPNVKLNAWSGDAGTSDFNTAEGTIFNFNGGTLVSKQICGANGVSPVLNWNGGTFKLPEGDAWGDMLKIENNTDFKVNVLSGGAVVDTSGHTSGFFAPVAGVGRLVKQGEGKLWNNEELDCRGGYRVEGGTLEIHTLGYGTTADTPVGEVYVAEGATLDLQWKDIYTMKREVVGSVINGVVYEVQDTTPVLATWTGDESDDVTCHGNWDVRTASGLRIYGALPTAGVKVVIPYDGELFDATNFESFSPVWKFSADSTFLGGALPPVLARTAISWYDAADQDTITLVNGGVGMISNKGSSGESLDLLPLSNDRPGYDNAEWSQNGNNVFAFTNSHGFISRGLTSISGKADRTMLVLSKQNYDDSERKFMFPMALEYGNNDPGSFFIKTFNWSGGAIGYSVTYLDEEQPEEKKEIEKWSASRANDWNIATMISDSGIVKAKDYSRNNNTTSNISEFESPSPEETVSASIVVGHYRPWGTESNGLWAEGFVFDKALTDAELETMRTYLKNKWFGDGENVTLPTRMELENNPTIDLNGVDLTLASIAGGGTLTNGTVAITGAIIATAGAALAIDCDVDITNASITPDDTFEVGDIYTITVTGTITGSPTLALDGGDTRKFRVRSSGNAVTLTCLRPGFALVIR